MTSQPIYNSTLGIRHFTHRRVDPTLDVERSAIKRLLADYEARLNEFEPGSWADGHISGAIEAIERVLLMELE
jgi:predicted component of type VI protein secretion system